MIGVGKRNCRIKVHQMRCKLAEVDPGEELIKYS